MKPRTVIVDDHTLLAEAFKKLLEGECDVVATYGDARQFLLDVPRLNPEVVILDLSMADLGGLEVLKTLRQLDEQARVIVVSADVQRSTEQSVKAAGAERFLAKPANAEQLAAAISDVLGASRP